jgi:hypothetical protein
MIGPGEEALPGDISEGLSGMTVAVFDAEGLEVPPLLYAFTRYV